MGNNNEAASKPWWVDILTAAIPMALWLGIEYRYELLEAAIRLREAVAPPRLEADYARLAWMRQRFEAGGYADDGGPEVAAHGA